MLSSNQTITVEHRASYHATFTTLLVQIMVQLTRECGRYLPAPIGPHIQRSVGCFDSRRPLTINYEYEMQLLIRGDLGAAMCMLPRSLLQSLCAFFCGQFRVVSHGPYAVLLFRGSHWIVQEFLRAFLPLQSLPGNLVEIRQFICTRYELFSGFARDLYERHDPRRFHFSPNLDYNLPPNVYFLEFEGRLEDVWEAVLCAAASFRTNDVMLHPFDFFSLVEHQHYAPSREDDGYDSLSEEDTTDYNRSR